MSGRKGRLGFRELMSHGPESARILIVEDEAEVRRSLARLVKSFGHEVKAAASAEEADQWISSESFDLVLLDIELPRMMGVEFLSWALGREPELAVLMLTGLDDPELAMDCLDAGARTYLVKPVEGEILRRAIRDALAVRRLLIERNDASRGDAF